MEVSLPVASQRGVVYPQIAPYTRCTRLRSVTANPPAEGPANQQNQHANPHNQHSWSHA